MYQSILEKLKEYNKVTIFHHVGPDGDAMFSSLALRTFIMDNFPDKKVKMAGYETFDLITRNDKTADSFIKKSLAIVLDTANKERIDDQRYALAPYLIKIDHHPDFDHYGNEEYVDTKSSSACELLARILMSKDFEGTVMSKECCKYLYCGIVTDSQNFSTSNTTHKTLTTASKLAKRGELIIGDIVSYVTDNDYETFSVITAIRSKLKTEKKFAYVILNQKELKKLGVSSDDAKNQVNDLTKISDMNIFAFAVENEEGTYDCSYRSKRLYIINNVAYAHGGGGHANACATRNLPYDEQMDIFKELIEYSTNSPKFH
ncbi:MAG: bifunctional oligoribonuclease/PAP phosphatase NrnA [Erysipelotrichaceae bacterium]|nr:bifunctional oligoribonuclease/PAP phosphatase NrnA [Erysipelotrichaceae bacterium]